MAGAKMLTNYPTSIVVHGVALNITVQSYNESLDFGLIACGEAMPDIAGLRRRLRQAVRGAAHPAGRRGDAGRRAGEAAGTTPAAPGAGMRPARAAPRPVKQIGDSAPGQVLQPAARPAANMRAI